MKIEYIDSFFFDNVDVLKLDDMFIRLVLLGVKCFKIMVNKYLVVKNLESLEVFGSILIIGKVGMGKIILV